MIVSPCAEALSKYTEMVDRIIREENDVLAAASDDARIALREMAGPRRYCPPRHRHAL
jgi:hypothetical protein